MAALSVTAGRCRPKKTALDLAVMTVPPPSSGPPPGAFTTSTSGTAYHPANLNSVLPADVTDPDAGIAFETNNLDLDGATVTTGDDSAVTVITRQVAAAYSLSSAYLFHGAYSGPVTSTAFDLSIQQMPMSDVQ